MLITHFYGSWRAPFDRFSQNIILKRTKVYPLRQLLKVALDHLFLHKFGLLMLSHERQTCVVPEDKTWVSKDQAPDCENDHTVVRTC